MLVPTTRSGTTCSSSSTLSTPTCAAPRAPPPLSTRTSLGARSGGPPRSTTDPSGGGAVVTVTCCAGSSAGRRLTAPRSEMAAIRARKRGTVRASRARILHPRLGGRRGILARMRAKKLSTRTLLYVVLAVATLAVYARVARFEFLNYDDGEYVSDNAYVQHGIDAKTLRWAFTTGSAVNWHPLTWISHMIDWTLFGSWAGGHHLMNVALHVANTLLLPLFLERATGATGRSAFAAALFALHPLHVESVAWVAERKD